jgi:hypothetical protein
MLVCRYMHRPSVCFLYSVDSSSWLWRWVCLSQHLYCLCMWMMNLPWPWELWTWTIVPDPNLQIFNYPNFAMYVVYSVCVCFLQASKAIGVIHMLQCYRAFDGRSKGIQMSYCVGLEVSGENYYLKADSARVFNDWIRVRLLLTLSSTYMSTKVSYS